MTLTLEEKLQRMYLKVSRGARACPDFRKMPREIGTMVDNQGRERIVYDVRPAIFLGNGEKVYAMISHVIPAKGFWDHDVLS